MPVFPNTTITRENAINQILSSIATEELSLSHILNAEGEKIQHILGTLPGQTVSGAEAGTETGAEAGFRQYLSLTVETQIILV